LKLFRWIVTLLVAALLVIFAVSNLQQVEVNFWPLPINVSTRLFVVVLLAAVLGFLVGELVAWVGGRRWRHEARLKQRQLEALERELAATHAQLKPADDLAGGLPLAGSTLIEHQGIRAPRRV
jgi:uncharacterized integral membrane protein